jgi:ribonucleoside-diphosphate reductase alpha chain
MPAPVPAQNFVSRGMTRGRMKNQNLLLISDTAPQTFAPAGAMQSSVTALRTATALKAEPEMAPSAFNAGELQPIPSPPPSQDARALRQEAQMKGYTGDQCTTCNSMRMKVSGHCMVCEDCGTTTGCS